MKVHLKDLFVPYETRIGILQHLCAWDIAKLDSYLENFLSTEERVVYINPTRDLFNNLAELDALLKAGMRIILLGNDVAQLYSRLRDPARHSEAIRRKRLQIYIVGLFPTSIRDEAILDRMIKFCAWDEPDVDRVAYDKASFRAIQGQRPDGMFIMSFGINVVGGRLEDRGFWGLSARTPDQSIDVRVYVPSFSDRILGQAVVKFVDLSRLSGRGSRFRRTQALRAFVRVYIRKYSFESAICFNVTEGMVKDSEQMSLLIQFAHTRSVMEVWI